MDVLFKGTVRKYLLGGAGGNFSNLQETFAAHTKAGKKNSWPNQFIAKLFEAHTKYSNHLTKKINACFLLGLITEWLAQGQMQHLYTASVN